MNTLYELTSEYLQLLEMASDPEVDEQVFNDTLEGLGGEIEIKADGYAKVIKQLTAESNACAEEEKRFASRKQTCDRRIKHMKEVLTNAMVATGKVDFKTDLFKFKVQNNPTSTIIDDETALDEKYFIIERKVNKSMIKDDINNGLEVPGAHLEQGQGVRIR